MNESQKDAYIKKLENALEDRKKTIDRVFDDAVALSEAFFKYAKPLNSVPRKYANEYNKINKIANQYIDSEKVLKELLNRSTEEARSILEKSILSNHHISSNMKNAIIGITDDMIKDVTLELQEIQKEKQND